MTLPPWRSAALALATAAVVFILYFPNVIPGVPPSGSAVGLRVGLALATALGVGAIMARTSHGEPPMRAGALVVLPAAILGGLLGLFTAMRPLDLLFIALLSVLFVGSAMLGGALAAREEAA